MSVNSHKRGMTSGTLSAVDRASIGSMKVQFAIDGWFRFATLPTGPPISLPTFKLVSKWAADILRTRAYRHRLRDRIPRTRATATAQRCTATAGK